MKIDKDQIYLHELSERTFHPQMEGKKNVPNIHGEGVSFPIKNHVEKTINKFISCK